MLHFTIQALTVLEILIAVILIALILAQKSKSGGGLGGLTGGGGGAEEVFGSQATSILTKATIYFGIFFLVNTLGLAVLHRHSIMDQNVSAVDQVSAGMSGQTPGVTAPTDSDAAAPAGETAPAATEDAAKTPAGDGSAPAATTSTAVEGSKTEAPATEAPATETPKPADGE